VVVLAGDIGVARKSSTFVDFLADLCDRHKAVVYVPGNHEYYGSSFDNAWEKMKTYMTHDNLHMLNGGESIVIDDVKFIGATLWTDFNNHNEHVMSEARYTMNDYHIIYRSAQAFDAKYSGKLIPFNTYLTHGQHRTAIESALTNQGEGQKTVVVTHHGPTLQSVHDRYWKENLNYAYVSDLSELIRERAPTVWVHGHVHDSFEYKEAGTWVFTNPKGYPNGYGTHENELFKESGVIPKLNELLS
jgi:Icc-related predicted phosphoesterase